MSVAKAFADWWRRELSPYRSKHPDMVEVRRTDAIGLLLMARQGGMRNRSARFRVAATIKMLIYLGRTDMVTVGNAPQARAWLEALEKGTLT